jgi:dihydroneopterin aldolase
VAALCLADARVVSVKVRSTKIGIYPDARVGCEIERTR